MSYKYTTKPNSSSHNFICKTGNCGNLAKSEGGPYRFCRSCRDKMNTDLLKKLNDVDKTDRDLTARKNERERLLRELESSENAIRDLEYKKFLEKMKITFENDLVSADHRYNDGLDSYGTKWTLETHCTIVRVKDSPEDVYFGHVTLKISSEFNEEYIWHYGAPVFGDIPPNLNPTFWKFKKHNPETTRTSEFANFYDIPGDMLLSNIMKQHLGNCADYFKSKEQWQNQVWYPTDQVGRDKERAIDLLKRLQEIKLERDKIDPEKAAERHEALMKEEREKERKELIRLQETQQGEKRRKEAVFAKRQAEALAIRKAAAIEENPVLSKEELEKRQKDRLDTYAKEGNERKLREIELAKIKAIEDAAKKIDQERLAKQNEQEMIAKKNEQARLASIRESETLERRKRHLEAVNMQKALEEMRKEQEEKELEKSIEERREKAKEAVEKFLTKINTDIKKIKMEFLILKL